MELPQRFLLITAIGRSSCSPALKSQSHNDHDQQRAKSKQAAKKHCASDSDKQQDAQSFPTSMGMTRMPVILNSPFVTPIVPNAVIKIINKVVIISSLVRLP